MISYAPPPVDTEADALNGQPHLLLQHANAPRMPTGSGIVWHSWGQGAVLVLVHDWNHSWQEWQHNIEPLSRKFQVCVAQLPGSPEKHAPSWDDTQAWALALRSDLHAFFPGQSFSLLGQGWGSILAAYIAPDMEQLSSLVLLGVGGHGSAPHLAAPQPDVLAAKLQRHWQYFYKPALLIWGEGEGVPSPSRAAITLAAGHEEREWMALPNAAYPLQQTCATEVNMVLTHWLLSHS